MPDPSDQESNASAQAAQNTDNQNGGGSAGAGASNGRSAQDIERELKETRSEAAGYRTKLRELEEKVNKHEAEKLSDTEKLTKQAQDAEARAKAHEARARDLSVRMEIERQARKLNIVDEDAAAKLLDASRIEFDDQGNAKNISALLDELVKARPFLVATQAASNGSATNPGRAGGNALTLDAIKNMTPEQINANWDAVQATLKAAR